MKGVLTRVFAESRQGKEVLSDASPTGWDKKGLSKHREQFPQLLMAQRSTSVEFSGPSEGAYLKIAPSLSYDVSAEHILEWVEQASSTKSDFLAFTGHHDLGKRHPAFQKSVVLLFDPEFEACQRARFSEDFPASAESARLAYEILRGARSLPHYFLPAVFGYKDGKVEIAFQDDDKRLSLFVDGLSRTAKVIRLSTAEKVRDQEVLPAHPRDLESAIQWMLKNAGASTTRS